ncbi:hypothetical protein QQS21_006237 [Conoideocrella luteorostrata]|uniref:Aminoglycoside phosphotransferase domain-containing protein n=1 Tax=Conoideocrella luteorostrata TaxID=1105319 RepID=A0AAJ0CS54_9HYPO|nr:hypothetical protein QQS21_006237 [Conoideocrella luteorostrata]
MTEYEVDDEIAAFFAKTTATREECEAKCRELTQSRRLAPVPVQGVCSYTVYGGDNLEYVIQCRLKSLALKTEMSDLATKVHGSLVPTVSFHGALGTEQDRREPLLVYLMTRMSGITQLDFMLARNIPQTAQEFYPLRQNFFSSVASFFAQSWLAPQKVCAKYRDELEKSHRRDLNLLLDGLPERFRPHIQTCLASLNDIMALPMVLLHKDFGACNLLVDPQSCCLKGVIDWAEAVISPFGLNLHSLQAFAGSMHLRNGWSRFPDYGALEHTFWSSFSREVGGISPETLVTIKRARMLGHFLSHGFTSRLANEAEPVPLKDDDHGQYHMMYLDGYWINPTTKVDDLDMKSISTRH